MADFKFVDNSDKVLKALQEQIGLGLEAVGLEAQTYAIRDCPVDTGRLRNSITYAIKDGQGEPNTQPKEQAEPGDYEVQSEPEKNTMYLGTNVEYASTIEYGDTIQHKNGKAHFLRDAVTTHSKEYEDIIKTALQN